MSMPCAAVIACNYPKLLGDLRIDNSSSISIELPSSTTAPIQVSSEAKFGGDLRITLPEFDTSRAANFTVIEYTSFTGEFRNMTVVNPLPPCSEVEAHYKPSVLIVAYTLGEDCPFFQQSRASESELNLSVASLIGLLSLYI